MAEENGNILEARGITKVFGGLGRRRWTSTSRSAR